MTARDLRIVVDCNDETCGPCRCRMALSFLGQTGPLCGVFGIGLVQRENGDLERASACLAAERAAMPWLGDPDDDGLPTHMHLEEETLP